MLITGLAVYLGVVLLLAKLPRRMLLEALAHGLAIDVGVTLLVFVIHFGTFSGLMAATIAGVLMSATTSAAKYLFGFIEGTRYYPGVFKLNLDK